MLRILSIAFLLLSASANCADKDAVQLSVSAGNISAQRQLIESKITSIEYQEMQNDDRVRLLTQLEAIDKGSIAGNTIIVYQDSINSILREAFADSMLVCSYEKPTGSKRSVRTCMTVAAKTRQHENVQQTRNTGVGPSASTANQ